MSDRASLSSSSEGAQSPSRRRNPSTTTDDDPQYHFDSLQEKQVGVATAASAPHTTTRRRPSRTTSGTKSSPRSASPPPPPQQQQSYDEDLNEGSDKKSSKPPRKTLKKLLRRDSHHTEIVAGSLQSGHVDVEEDEGSTVGYIPRLGQIRERKTSMQSRRRGSSIVSSSGQPRALRRRHTDDSSAVSRIRAQRKHGSSHRHGGKLAQLSEPSSASSVSQQSSASSSSSGSNSTVTQKSREDHDYTYQYETFGDRQRLAMQASMLNASPESEVFKYLQPGNDAESSVFTGSSQAASSTSLPLSFSDHSVATSPQDANGSNVTLQTSVSTQQQSSAPAPHLPHQEFRKFKKPLYASSFVHGPADDDDETVNQSAESEPGSDTEGEEETKESTESSPPPPPPKVEEAKAPPPRPQSTSSRGSDPHVRRLKQQERELANHILKNPRPQKQFQFNAAGTPAQPYPPVPMYSPQGYSASPSVVGSATTGNPPPAPQGWPPMHTFPAPLAIGYAPHQSPEVAHAYPHSMVSQMPPPFSPHGSQPPRYQQHAPASPGQTKYSMAGYELLANELSAPSPDEAPRAAEMVPVYRKFEHLNHRVLLHLQDETCELEEELRHLDRCIAHMSPKNPTTGHAYPASRRNDARYGGDLHFKRTELLGRIFQKLEQYNKALASFSNVSRNLGPASADEIARYREWMDSHEAVDDAESQFLERAQDLVAIRREGGAKEAAGQQQHPSAAVWFPLILVVPLMAFAIVPSLLGRLVVIVLIVGVELKLVASAPELRGFLSGQEWTAAVSV